jgi:hypothetical protein
MGFDVLKVCVAPMLGLGGERESLGDEGRSFLPCHEFICVSGRAASCILTFENK